MAVESFFVIETSFSDLREKLREEIVRVDKEYDGMTICYDYGLVLMLFKEFFWAKTNSFVYLILIIRGEIGESHSYCSLFKILKISKNDVLKWF